MLETEVVYIEHSYSERRMLLCFRREVVLEDKVVVFVSALQWDINSLLLITHLLAPITIAKAVV